MRVFYGLIITAVILMIGACALKAYKKEGALARVVFLYELGAFICGIIFLVYTYVPGITITVLCKGLIMASFDWLLILLMYYTQYYTGMFKGIMGVKVFMIAYSLLETVAFLINTWTRWIFDITDISDDQIIVQFAKGNVLGRLHYVFAYGIMLLLILSYIVMVERMSRFYRFRYFAILILLLAASLLDIMTTWSDSIYDMSMAAFGIMSVLIYYLTYSYVPNELIENTFSLIIRDMNSGIICFDNAGRCIYCNGIVKEMYSINDNINEVEHNYASWLHTQTEHDNKKFRQTISVGDERRSFDISYNRVYDDKHNFICDYFIFNDRTEAVELLEYEKFRATHDNLTGLLNKEQFYEETANVVRNDRNHTYCLVCSNIKDFKLVNELFGIEKGDEIIKMQAELIKASSESGYICGRIQNDRFAVCMPKDSFKNEIMQNSIVSMQDRFNNASFKIRVVVGVYDIEDVDEPVSNMCDKAFIASETIKNNYETNIAYYDDKLLKRTLEERRVISEFEGAIEKKEFKMFLQPQVNTHGKAYGAEALVRWQHPERGLLSPFFFIDILETTGLIYKLDMYMWECAAAKLSEWKKKGDTVHYISVNISTKDFYLIDVYEVITSIVKKYDIEPKMLKLEITETALMSDLKKNMEVIKSLRDYGFKIEIDDFGSGYSSLNMLKDISADVLKIDMKFLDGSGDDGRSENILASVVRMAKWLNMPVVAEGAERKEQVSFLHSIGCEYVQGFYFARPMPVKKYEKLLYEQPYFEDDETRRTSNDTNAIWTANMQMEMIFSNMMQAAAIYEYSDGNIEVVRVNDAYFDMFGYHDTDRVHKEIEGSIDHVDRERFMDTFAQVVENQSTAECEVKRFLESGREIWIKLRLKYINRVGERHIIFGCIDDITVQREMDNELAKYRLALMEEEVNEKIMLVVDDMEINRASLESIFETDYRILQAGDGEEALRILEEQNYKVDMILLDLMMPGMNGQTFMQERKNDPRILNIPVVIITADDTTEQQVLTMELGASDYIVKPFIPEIVTRRVQNVWDSTRRKKEVLQEHHK